jgi:hypothetical protein
MQTGASGKSPDVSAARETEHLADLIATMKRAAAALRDAEVPTLLAGGLAIWARGGPASDHDVDFYVRKRDAERALQALVAGGMEPERPPEGWLLKAYDEGGLVDLIFRTSADEIDDDHFNRAEAMVVAATDLLVASVYDLITPRLLALGEQELDLAPALALARSLRERIEWDRVQARTASSPFARTFFVLLEELEVIAPRTSHNRAPLAAAT